MPKIPQKDPRYKPVNSGNSRKYLDQVTGELISRREFEKRTGTIAQGSPAGSQPAPQKSQASPGFARAKPRAQGTGTPEAEIGYGPVPLVEVPEPPPAVQAAYDVTREAAEVAHAAARSMDKLADKIGEGIAWCASYMAGAFLPDRLQYLTIDAPVLSQVTKPAARIAARHMPVTLDLGPDAEDLGDLFNGVMACVTAISVNRLRMKQEELRLIKEFEAKNGPGSYAEALAAARGQAAPSNQQYGQAQGALGTQGAAGNNSAGGAAAPGMGGRSQPGNVTLIDDLVRSASNGHRQQRSN